MMDTANLRVPEVAMIMAGTEPVDGATIHWLISKKQVEYILTDIAELPPDMERPHLKRAQYLEQVLPVISLEKYYGLTQTPPAAGYRYVVTKYATSEGRLGKVVLRLCNPIRVRRLTFESPAARQEVLQANSPDILGAFTLPDNELAIIPDFTAILDRLA